VSARLTLETGCAEATMAAGAALGRLLAPADVVLLSGDLGAGKTQLVKGVAIGLGVNEPVTSPTFNILLVHEGHLPLYHFDLYRLEHSAQLEDIDYAATLEADGVAMVEWGDRFAEASPLDGLSVALHIIDDERRQIEVSALGPRGEELAAAWSAACADVSGAVVRADAGERS
jgi:tRNA threonylcarbamoyladenosine biosynthesis protein TsaE